MLFTDSVVYDLIGILCSLLTAVVIYYKWTVYYWNRKGLEGPEPSFPFGNSGPLILGKKHIGEMYGDVYFYLKSKNLPYGVVYLFITPVFVAIDLHIAKLILKSDFTYFAAHGNYVNGETNPLSANIFNLNGPKWKSARTKLTPTFTSGKIRMMFQTLLDCSDHLNNMLDDYSKRNVAIEIKDIMGRYTTDIIGSCAFGFDCNSMKDPNSKFREMGLKAFRQDLKASIRLMSEIMFPKKMLDFIGYSSNDTDVIDFFLGIVKETIDYREKNNVNRKDFMDMLIKLKNKGSIDDKDVITSGGSLTENEIAAHSFIFFLAGFETSSSTMNFASYELAINPDIQKKLREEINSVIEKHDNKVTYEAIMDMHLLDRVICESLRKYPPAPALFRRCTKDYKIPDSKIVIKNGMISIIPILGIHRDPEYYPDPDKFDPERFTEENKAKRPQFTWLPFGEGPRICIGLRFGMIQSKIGLITLLRNYRITLNKKTPLPPVLSKHGVVIGFEGGMWFDLHKVAN